MNEQTQGGALLKANKWLVYVAGRVQQRCATLAALLGDANGLREIGHGYKASTLWPGG